MFAEHDLSFDIRPNILLKEMFVLFVSIMSKSTWNFLMILLFALFEFLAFLYDYTFESVIVVNMFSANYVNYDTFVITLSSITIIHNYIYLMLEGKF